MHKAAFNLFAGAAHGQHNVTADEDHRLARLGWCVSSDGGTANRLTRVGCHLSQYRHLNSTEARRARAMKAQESPRSPGDPQCDPVGAENPIRTLTRRSAEPTASFPTLGATEAGTRFAQQALMRPPDTSSLVGARDEISAPTGSTLDRRWHSGWTLSCSGHKSLGSQPANGRSRCSCIRLNP